MQPDQSERRREPRFPIEAGAVVEVHKNGHTARATTVDMGGFGALLQFQEPFPLAVGDRVMCEFELSHDADRPLPYWGMGHVVRVEGRRVAVDFQAGGFVPVE